MLAICGLVHFVRQRRLVAIIWLLLAYFGVAILFLTIEGAFIHTQPFTLVQFDINNGELLRFNLFALGFNLIFGLTDLGCSRWLHPFARRRIRWNPGPRESRTIEILIRIYGSLLIVSSLLTIVMFRGSGYTDFVERNESSWPMVFLMASSPFIAFCTIQRRYWLALAACLPFLLIAIQLNVRTFLLPSVITVVLVHAFREISRRKINLRGGLARWAVTVVALVCLLLVSSRIMSLKTGKQTGIIALPDFDLVTMSPVVMAASDVTNTRTGWDSLALYHLNLINPFLRLMGVERPEITDPPVVMARFIEGVPENWPRFYHYPSLIYADAYLSFGYAGLWMAVYWALILMALELILVQNMILFGVMVPYYSWHAYLLVRGATAGASVQCAYSIYFSLIIAFVVARHQLLMIQPSRRPVKVRL